MTPAIAFALFAATPADAQIVYTARNGGNLVYCGPIDGGPIIHKRFFTPEEVHDDIAVAHDGEGALPPTAAAAHFDSVPSADGLSLHFFGSASRGEPTDQGANATADGRDSWEFTLAAPTPFRLYVSLHASSTEATVPLQAFNFGALDGSIELSDGSIVQTISHHFSVPGDYATTLIGTLSPGHYFLSLFGRAEGINSPFEGSYDNELVLILACAGDFNADGTLNVFDFLAFQTAFSNGDPSADLAAPFGMVNVFDFLAFQTAFSTGC